MYKGRPMAKAPRATCGYCGHRRLARNFPKNSALCVYCLRGIKNAYRQPGLTDEERAAFSAAQLNERIKREIRLRRMAKEYKTVWDLKQALKRKGVMKDESKRRTTDPAGYSISVRGRENPRFPANYISGYRGRSGLGNPRISKD